MLWQQIALVVGVYLVSSILFLAAVKTNEDKPPIFAAHWFAVGMALIVAGVQS
jgi:hypothetical protein